ncbi:hypothetical protein TVAG_071190 [Trichomonas vaginalis G3]|uniref:Surface antigen BspA-like n=1 Tax=Trichomonas vaginalis (strain ATCC PRA-98 / G3) TaxID=412133 RepID=A2D822_TRIV3|nr:ribonuclease inhibitor domain-containing protein [Trichomonas vaginalis G3]EAY23455.1 hypothetical protein TVAG_071190 [Trichomonas vaginalis G3]KAI5493868.1 ribonuclease inhibitor domain-containing protein [Trichomonas vaginalis G3]|eukprot:XP_001584441.1 hypothetical protein [Trichomonas vaginalis G3]
MAAFQSTKLTSIDIPKSLLYVDNLDDSTFWGGVFQYNINLMSINIPYDSSLKSIGYYVASGAPFTRIFIPKFCYITKQPFMWNGNLQTIELHPENPYHKLYKGCLYSYDYSSLCCVPADLQENFEFHPFCYKLNFACFHAFHIKIDLVIPPQINESETLPFYECYPRSIIFENNFDCFDREYFRGSNSRLVLPKILKIVNAKSFNYILSSYIEFYSEMELIKSNAFNNCPYLEFVKFNKLKNPLMIETNAFVNCLKLKEIIFPFESADFTTFNSSALSMCNSFKGIKYYLTLTKNIRQQAFKSNDFIDIEVYYSDTEINKSCGHVTIKHPFDQHCSININSCNINVYRSIFELEYTCTYIFVIE